MQKLIAFVFLCSSLHAFSQNTYKVTMNGIGPFKIGMPAAEVEKLTSTKLKFVNLLKKEWTFDTLNITYNDLPCTLVFDKQFGENDKQQLVLREVNSKSNLIATPSGITISDDKLKIINTYTQYTIWIIPAYENDYKSRSATNTDVMVLGDETGNIILFHLYMNKVVSISVTYNDNYD